MLRGFLGLASKLAYLSYHFDEFARKYKGLFGVISETPRFLAYISNQTTTTYSDCISILVDRKDFWVCRRAFIFLMGLVLNYRTPYDTILSDAVRSKYRRFLLLLMCCGFATRTMI